MSAFSRTRCHLVALTLTGALVMPGCLVGEPETLEQPDKVAPQIVTHNIAPTTQAVIQTGEGSTTFAVPFISEDLGDNVVGKLYLNYEQSGEQFLGGTEVPASTLENTNREIRIEWAGAQTVPVGCHSITMTIAHKSNYPSGAFNLKPEDPTLTTFVHWITAHDISPDQLTLDDCPSPGEDIVVEQDASPTPT